MPTSLAAADDLAAPPTTAKAGDVFNAYMALLDDTATDEQIELVGPDGKEEARRLRVNLRQPCAHYYERMLRHPEVFAPEDRPAILKARREYFYGTPRQGRAARVATNTRRRGSRRGAESRSSGGGGSGDPDPEPPGPRDGANQLELFRRTPRWRSRPRLLWEVLFDAFDELLEEPQS